MTEQEPEYCSLYDAEILRETERAFLVKCDAFDKEWIPKSQIRGAECYGIGEVIDEMLVTRWLLVQRGLL
jgi:hypothetical protein